MHYYHRCALGLVLVHLLAGASLAATADEIRSAVEARYRYTVPGFLGDYRTIGSVLVVGRDGLRANRPAALFKPNVIESGRVTVAGGGDLPPGGNADGVLKTGDRLYLYGVRTGEDYVELQLFTVGTFVLSGIKGATPLQASTRFRYEGGLAAVGTGRIMNDIALWFTTDNETLPASEAKRTATVRLGQTEDEVIAIFGAPDRKILLGSKTVYVYRNVKVVFIDGKVADAE